MHPTQVLRTLRAADALATLPRSWRERYCELCLGGGGNPARPIGWISKRILAQHPHRMLQVREDEPRVVRLAASRQQDVDELVRELHARGVFTGWRGEPYAVTDLGDSSRTPLFVVERASARVFGLVRQSIHVNGFVKSATDTDPTGNTSIKMWIGTRSKTKPRFPGMLDNIVAGGLPSGMSPLECAIKECGEEASIEESVARARLKCVNTLTRACEEDGFVALEEIFVFDLDLSDGTVVPKPQDGEVESFALMTSEELFTRENIWRKVKPNVLCVLADFLIRHQGLRVDTHEDASAFAEIVAALHAPCPQHVYSQNAAKL